MTKTQAAVYIQAMVECARCDIEAMKVANIMALQAKQPLPYGPASFNEVPNRYGIHHNAVIETFQAAYDD